MVGQFWGHKILHNSTSFVVGNIQTTVFFFFCTHLYCLNSRISQDVILFLCTRAHFWLNFCWLILKLATKQTSYIFVEVIICYNQIAKIIYVQNIVFYEYIQDIQDMQAFLVIYLGPPTRKSILTFSLLYFILL